MLRLNLTGNHLSNYSKYRKEFAAGKVMTYFVYC